MNFNLINEFYEEMRNISFDMYGIIDSNYQIHTLGTDSKIIGRIFEMIVQPVLENISKRYNFILETPESQTVYPDFILLTDKQSTHKIAIDIKTTYRQYSSTGKIKNYVFTLGSYASYMRNNTKNIAYQYTDYMKHYVIGFIYDRNDAAQESKVYSLNELSKINVPFKNVEYFIQEKYKIAGEKPGSGNTENIGSFQTNLLSDLQNGTGPFSTLGEDVYNLYWKYYPKYRHKKLYTNLTEFSNWFLNQTTAPTLLKEYSYNEVKNKLEKWKQENG